MQMKIYLTFRNLKVLLLLFFVLALKSLAFVCDTSCACYLKEQLHLQTQHYSRVV